jgi:capsule biosynthesis phosphatase
MIYILLCGGIGKRMDNYSLPKPLNYINGKHMIEIIINNIPSDTIYIIYNVYLKEFNFEEIVLHLFKNKQIYFSEIDYLTRGALETAYIGINKFNLNSNENIVFLDNDNIHELININYKLELCNENFIGYSTNCDENKKNYSFITIENGLIKSIVEKQKISDNYCCGIYGVKNIDVFNLYAKKILLENLKASNEFYFSKLYELILQDNLSIIPIFIEKTTHVGTLNELTDKIKSSKFDNKITICFDIDNTLFTYPTVPNDYTTVKPIHKMINLLKKLKKDGNYIILHTARRMKTHNNNIGKIIKDVGVITINTLNKYEIEYDELIFGKPYADIYIDDKSLNPYINNISQFGIIDNNNYEFINNKVNNNKYNTIYKNNDIITKTGKTQFLKGEIYFYKMIPNIISKYFCKFFDSCIDEQLENSTLKIEFINAIPLYFLHKNQLINTKIIDNLLYILDDIHSVSYHNNITEINIYNNYFKKLQDRFNNKDYFFIDANNVYEKIIDDLNLNYSPKIVQVIHGDFWFSNILLDYKDEYKLIDMKGQVDNILTLNGDIYYDYGKMYQSILGYDLYLNDCSINNEYLVFLQNYFLNKCTEKGLNINYLKSVTNSLIFGSFNFIENNETKLRLWDFLKNNLYTSH